MSTVFTPALERLKNVQSAKGEILTKPFLDVCKLILPILDKFGPSMGLAKSDIEGNISRLESRYSSDPSKFSLLYGMVRASSDCADALLWLTRAMDFLVQLFRNLLEHPNWTMPQACTDSYKKTLKKWHSWIASFGFTVAIRLALDRRKFMEVIGESGNVNADMEKFCESFAPLLQENHNFLASIGHDHLRA